MLITAATNSPTAYWYLTRGTGTVVLVLVTLSVALGIANIRRLRTEQVPRFVLDAVHRNVSLLAMAFLVLHIITSLLDGFAPIRIVDVVIPFASSYRPLWLGFGAVAFDLMVAIVITSLLRRRFGYRAWRITHWAAYASWPFALLHGLGTGSDTKAGWMLVIVAGCVIVMIVAVVARATAGWPDHPGPRLAALAGSALVPLGLLIWLPSGPLAAGWATKAGTPASLLRLSSSSTSASSASSSSSSSSSPAPTSFTAHASGSVSQTSTGEGAGRVDISLTLSGQSLSHLGIELRGRPLPDGGLHMETSAVTLGTQAEPRQYQGAVTSLNNTDLNARVSDSAGHHLALVIQLQLSQGGNSASGTVSARS